MENPSTESEKFSANVDEDEVIKLVKEMYNIQTQTMQKLNGFDDLNFHVLPKVRDQNVQEETRFWEYGCVLKIINWKDSINSEYIDEYINVLLHLSKTNLPCSCPIKNKFGKYTFYWTDKKENTTGHASEKHQHIIFMLTYIPGVLLESVEYDASFCFSLGQLINKLHKALQIFNKSTAIINRTFLWSLHAIPNILNYVQVIKDAGKRAMIFNSLIEFQERVLSVVEKLERGVIHGDLNESNLLVKQTNKGNIEIAGIIDFCDMSYSCYLFELAITVTYLTLSKSIDECEHFAAALISGYGRQLTSLELSLFKICICARVSQSLTLGLYTYSLYPTNEYVLKTQAKGWHLLEKLRNTEDDVFIQRLQSHLDNFNKQVSNNL